MIKLRNILIPTDFSECSQAAIRQGFELARTFDAVVHLLHVVEDPNATAWTQGFPLAVVEILEQFQEESRMRLLDSIPEADRGRVVVSCPIAAPEAEILRYAQDESIDLIVMGTHGRGFIAHALMGSVAERVVRRAPCPVLTVRRPQHSAINNILVATDFQPASRNALRYGRALAAKFGARLHVLHVTENNFMAVASAYGYASVPAGVQEEIEAAARIQTERLLTEEERRTGQATATMVSAASPAAAIVDHAHSHQIDLLVLGTHGRGALSRILMGSVARRVVRVAGCPVLTVRCPEREFVLPDDAEVPAAAAAR